jgi:hypothetical protein
MSYKKVKTVLVYGKKKCIYMKPKGTREYVKSKGEYVLLPVYVKRVAKIAAKKLIKNKNGKKKLRGGEHKTKTKTVLSLQVMDVNNKKVLDLCEITDLNTELVLLSKEKVDDSLELENNLVDILIRVKDEDIYLDKKEDVIIINVRSDKKNKEYIKIYPERYWHRAQCRTDKGTNYYKRDNDGKIEKIYSTEIEEVFKYDGNKGGWGGPHRYYCHIFKLKKGETIYSEKDRCKLKGVNGSIEFNKKGVKEILDDYIIIKPFKKLYIYDSTGYKEIDVPNYLQDRNLHYLAKHNKDSENPVTHTRYALTPNSHSNSVTADIVDNPQKSKKSMISKIVGIVDKVKLTTRPGPTYATNDSFKMHYEIKDAFKNPLQQKSTLSKIKNIFSRKNTGHKKNQMLLENKLFENRSRSSSSRKGRRSSS